MLDHWDNLDRHVVRGYAGLSLWDWQTLPRFRDPRYTDYARADASIGINGIVLNNVNANADILTPAFSRRSRRWPTSSGPRGSASISPRGSTRRWRSARLPTADPLDPRVRAWWRAKADEIYRADPRFRRLPGQGQFGRPAGPAGLSTARHADGANMIAEALAPHGGVVIWRAFVYSAENGGPAEAGL